MSPNMQEDCLLITSTAYLEDILNLLCLPEGIAYRFRYRKEWIQTGLLENPSLLKNKRGIIIYFHGSKKEEALKEFIPLREVKIEEAQRLGDVLYISFIVGKFFEYKERTDTETHPNSYHNGIYEVMKANLANKEPYLNKYIMLAPPLKLAAGADQTLTWTNLIRWFWDLEPFLGASFFKIVRIIDDRRKTLVSKELVKGEFDVPTSGYTLESGRTYMIELFQRTSDITELISPFEYMLVGPESIITVKNPKVVGKYDKLNIILSTRNLLTDVYTGISLGPSSDVEAKIRTEGSVSQVKVVTPQPYIPIRIKRISFKLPITLIVSGIIMGASSRLSNLWFQLSGFQLSEIELSIIGATGLLFVALGVAGFRKTV